MSLRVCERFRASERESGRDDGNGSILVYSHAVPFVTQPAGFASEVVVFFFIHGL